MTEQPPFYNGQRLGELLAAQGIRQDWLAGQAGVSESHLSRVVRGKRLVSRAVAERIASVLRVPFFVAFDLPEQSELLPIGSSEEAVA